MIKFRIAKEEDLVALNRISLDSKKYWGYPEEWIKNWIHDLTLSGDDFSRQYIIIGEIGSEIIGFCSMIEHENVYEVLNLWVVPNYIGLGYGKKLLAHTINAFVCSDKSIIVTADPNAALFYKKQGFETFDKTESYPKGRFLPIMKKIKPNN